MKERARTMVMHIGSIVLVIIGPRARECVIGNQLGEIAETMIREVRSFVLTIAPCPSAPGRLVKLGIPVLSEPTCRSGPSRDSRGSSRGSSSGCCSPPRHPTSISANTAKAARRSVPRSLPKDPTSRGVTRPLRFPRTTNTAITDRAASSSRRIAASAVLRMTIRSIERDRALESLHSSGARSPGIPLRRDSPRASRLCRPLVPRPHRATPEQA